MKKLLALTLLAAVLVINPACRNHPKETELQSYSAANPVGHFQRGAYVDPTGTGRHDTGNDPNDARGVDPNGPGIGLPPSMNYTYGQQTGPMKPAQPAQPAQQAQPEATTPQ